MHGNPEHMATEPIEVMPPSHNRILVIMAVLGLASSVLTAIFFSARFGLGLLIGSALAFGNYYWLKRSLQKVFAEAKEGEKARISALRYIFRYVAMAAVIGIIYASGVLPVVSVILGLGGFGFAVVIDGIIRIFSGVPDAKVDQ
jgi:hypothetical protein